jgi:hypothetical protein
MSPNHTAEALKPCPFDDGARKHKVCVDRRQGRHGTACPSKWFRESVVCSCGARGAEFKQPGKAITAWNTRRAPAVPALVTDAERAKDIAWLERQRLTGHCGEENSEIRWRHKLNQRIDRIIRALSSIPVDREAVARIIDPKAWEIHDDGAFSAYPEHQALIAKSLSKADQVISLIGGSGFSSLQAAARPSAPGIETDTDSRTGGAG